MFHFNPRARKERDTRACYSLGKNENFNPRARKERDTGPVVPKYWPVDFNPRARKERDITFLDFVFSIEKFQSTRP